MRRSPSSIRPSRQQDFDQLGVQAVAALVGDEVADEVAAGQGQVADQVEGLVPDAFVFQPQLVVDRAFRAEDEQVLVGDPRAQAAARGASRLLRPG